MTYSVVTFRIVTERIASYSALDNATERDLVQLAEWTAARSELVAKAHALAISENV